MKQASYSDELGRHWVVLLPEGSLNGDAPLGIPLGPPSLERLGLPQEIEVALHNQLYHRGLLTYLQAKRRKADVQSALQTALRVDVEKIVELYKEESSADN